MTYTAKAGTLSGALISSAVGEFLPSWFEYFNPRAPDWQDTPPENVGIGQEIGIHVRYGNPASVPQDMTAHVYIYDPDGIEVARKEPAPIGVAAGGNAGAILTTTNTTKLGAYTAEALLYADGELVDAWEGLVAGTIIKEITGEFIENMFRYWNDEVREWEEEPPTNIRAATIGIYTSGRNTGTGTQRMTIETIIKDPQGRTIKTEKPAAIEVEPIKFVHSDVYTYDLTTPGTYTAECKLLADDEVVDTWSDIIASVSEVIKPEKLPLWAFMAGGGGIGTLGGLMGKPRAITLPLGVAFGAGIGYLAYKIYEWT